MSKPIFIIRIPQDNLPSEYLDVRDYISKTIEECKRVLDNEYHVIVTVDRCFNTGDIRFECYNAKEAKEIDFELLQKRILELIEKK